MWARRCGVPKHWPSRIKVTIHSFIHALIGFTIFKYLTSADVGYLDLSEAVTGEVLCLSKWPLRFETETWLRDDAYAPWVNAVFNSNGFVEENRCPEAKSHTSCGDALTSAPWMAGCAALGWVPWMRWVTSCGDAYIPMRGLERKLGYPLGTSVNRTTDILATYSGLFLYLGFCLFLTTTIHDLSLISVRNHNYILDIQGVRKHFPRLLRRMSRLTGFPCLIEMTASDNKAVRIGADVLISTMPTTSATSTTTSTTTTQVLMPSVTLWSLLVLMPFATLWSVLVFAFVWWPTAVMAFIYHPVKLSRLACFTNSLLFCVYGLCLTLHSLVFLLIRELRPLYALTWTPSEGDCYCGCIFHISQSSVLQVLAIGVTVALKGGIYSFRCLKGLRRSNWASLLTVMFQVPLAVYPVWWTQPCGEPIRHREEGEPVQGELAFDPFALMDEQPNSAHTTLRLEPVRAEEAKVSEVLGLDSIEITGPKRSTSTFFSKRHIELVGVCGFPYTVGRAGSPLASPRSNRPRTE